MSDTGATEQQAKAQGQNILNTALTVIKDPAGFFRGMPKSGGFGDPLVFLVVMGVVSGILSAVFSLFHLGGVVSMTGALMMVIWMPIAVLIGGFIGAAILFVIWKLMGSSESYETAYRCGAYAGAISPITTILGFIPFVGPMAGLVWMLFLLVTASVEVHKIAAKTAWMVFGIIAAILALASISAQLAARRAAKAMSAWGQEMNIKPGEEITPEQAGRAAAAFMKGMQEQAAKQAKEETKDEPQE